MKILKFRHCENFQLQLISYIAAFEFDVTIIYHEGNMQSF